MGTMIQLKCSFPLPPDFAKAKMTAVQMCSVVKPMKINTMKLLYKDETNSDLSPIKKKKMNWVFTH